jgi:flagellin-like protein
MVEKGLKPVINKNDKGVSPIIATILLVAITVILASTLYLALGGFFSHIGTTTPSASISVTGNTTVSSTEVNYSVTVGSPSATVPWTSTAFSVTLNNSTSYTLSFNNGNWIYPTTSPYIYINSTSGNPLTGNAAAATLTLTIHWTKGPVYLTSISYLDTASSGGGTMGTTSSIG